MTARPSATRDATASSARAGLSGHPAASATDAASIGPCRIAATSRPRPWRNEPANVDCPLLTPADPMTGSGSGHRDRAQAHELAIGPAWHAGERFVHTAAPRSKTARPHAHG